MILLHSPTPGTSNCLHGFALHGGCISTRDALAIAMLYEPCLTIRIGNSSRIFFFLLFWVWKHNARKLKSSLDLHACLFESLVGHEGVERHPQGRHFASYKDIDLQYHEAYEANIVHVLKIDIYIYIYQNAQTSINIVAWIIRDCEAPYSIDIHGRWFTW